MYAPVSPQPQPSLWARVLRRHTPFALEAVEADFRADFAWGKINVVPLPRAQAAVLGDLFLQVTLPAVPGATWVRGVGYALMRRVRLLIGEVTVQDQERLWMDIWDRLFCPPERRAGLDELLGYSELDAGREHTLTVPLQLLCCKTHRERQLWLPLLSTPGCDLRVEVHAETLENCLQTPPPPDGWAPAAPVRAKLLCDVAFLGPEELRLLETPRTLLIDSVQDVEATNRAFDAVGQHEVASMTLSLKEVNRPVKLLAWVAYDTSAVASRQYFTYYDPTAASLLIGGGERVAERNGDYFALQQPYAIARARPACGVAAYSFALFPQELMPSGSLDFSVVDAPRLRVASPAGSPATMVKAFALCHAFLRVDKGRVTVLFE